MQKRILIVRTDKVGDVVMITPMIRELRRTFHNSFIATLTTPNTKDILLNNPHIDLIITDDLKKENFWSVVRELRKHKFTHGLLVMPTERAAYQMFFAGIKYRIGVGQKLYEVITFMKSVSRYKYIPLRHEADYCMDLARAIGVKSTNLTPEIFLTEEEKELGKSILQSINVNQVDYKIILHTGSGNSSRNWREEKYFTLIKNILDKHSDAKIILTAKEMSESFKQSLIEMDDNRIIFANNTNRLRELFYLISNVDLLIASSTGPLHLASALKIKTIGLYCHRRMNCAKHWGALGEKAINLEVNNEYCDIHCSNDKEVCKFDDGIPVEEVLKLI